MRGMQKFLKALMERHPGHEFKEMSVSTPEGDIHIHMTDDGILIPDKPFELKKENGEMYSLEEVDSMFAHAVKYATDVDLSQFNTPTDVTIH